MQDTVIESGRRVLGSDDHPVGDRISRDGLEPRLGTHPPLTGMRGIAMVLIFLFHSNVPGFTGAFTSLELFFVLSGFLITALLLQEHQAKGTISLKAFYIRRALRLGPALLFFLACYLVFCFSFYQDWPTRRHHLEDALIVLLYMANWTRAFGLHRPDGLGHCWSLSVEEQFYFLWPLIVLFLVRFAKNRRSLLIALLLPLPWLWRSYLLFHGADWDRLYNGFDCRADALLAGCFLASLWHAGHLANWHRHPFFAKAAAMAAFAVLAGFTVVARWQSAALYLWQYAIILAATAVVIIDITHRPRGFLARLLALPPMVGLGTISYGLYLWHFPIIGYVGVYGVTGAAAVFLSAALTLSAAIFSWFVIERPALRLKRKYVVVDRE